MSMFPNDQVVIVEGVRKVRHRSGGRVMTKQADAAAADANVLVRRWLQRGELQVTREEARYGDFSSGLTFHESLLRVKAAEEEFAGLPARIRKACENDPAKFLQMVFDPTRRAELEALGLVEKMAPPAAPPAGPPAAVPAVGGTP